jgi:hypothetical protein
MEQRSTVLPSRPQIQQSPATRALERQNEADRRALEALERFHCWYNDDDDLYPRHPRSTNYPSTNHTSKNNLAADVDGSFPSIEWDPTGERQAPFRGRPVEDARRRLLHFKRPRSKPLLQRSPECPDTMSLLDFASACLQ